MRTEQEVNKFLKMVTDKKQEYYIKGVGYSVPKEEARLFDSIAVQQAMLKWFLGEEI